MTNILAWYMIWMQPRIEGTCFSQASYFGRKCHSKSQSFMQNVCTAQRQPSYSTMTMVESPVRMANTPRGPGTIRTIHHGLAFKHLQDWKYRAAWPILDRKKNSWWVHVPIHSILVISSTHPTFQRMNIHQTTIANPERNRPAACFEIPPSNKFLLWPRWTKETGMVCVPSFGISSCKSSNQYKYPMTDPWC